MQCNKLNGVVFTQILGTVQAWERMRWSREEAPFANGYASSVPRSECDCWAACAVTKSRSRWVRKQRGWCAISRARAPEEEEGIRPAAGRGAGQPRGPSAG